jgi:hypothetical protein
MFDDWPGGLYAWHDGAGRAIAGAWATIAHLG